MSLDLVARQTREGLMFGYVTCECGTKIELWGMVFRCLYCGVWFCRRCAVKHFGYGPASWEDLVI